MDVFVLVRLKLWTATIAVPSGAVPTLNDSTLRIPPFASAIACTVLGSGLGTVIAQCPEASVCVLATSGNAATETASSRATSVA